MKKLSALLLGAICTLTLWGCGDKKGEISQTSHTVTQSSQTGTDEDIDIKYPVLPEYSATINEMIKQEALRVLDAYEIDVPEEERLSLEIDYEIKLKTDDLISIVFEGLGYIQGTAHPNNFFYTLNIDAKTAKKVRLADRVTVDDSFIQAVYQAARDIPEPEIYDAFMNSYEDKDALLQRLYDADGSDDWPQGTSAFSYFTPTSVGVSLPIGTFHVEIEVPTDKIV